MWAMAIAIAQAVDAYGGAELLMPRLRAGDKVFSNAVVRPSSASRVLVEHANGLSAVRVLDLDPESLQQLNQAGVATGPIAEELLRQAQAIKAKETDSSTTNKKAYVSGLTKKGSVANLISEEVEEEAEEQDTEEKVAAFLSRLPVHWEWMLSGIWFAASLCRRWFYFRIHEASTGHRSWLVFSPLFRWIPMMKAAHMSLQWLFVPVLAIVAVLLPPPLEDSRWAVLTYLGFVGLLWLGVGILYIVWCIRLCAAVERSPLLAFLLMLPLLDWIALFVLASGSGKQESATPVAATRVSIPI
jgi:hypothetical protein